MFIQWVKVKCEDMSSTLYRVVMSKMCAPIVSSHQRPNILHYYTVFSSAEKKTSFQTRTAFLSKNEIWHTLPSLAASLLFNRPQLSVYGIISQFTYTFIYSILKYTYKEVSGFKWLAQGHNGDSSYNDFFPLYSSSSVCSEFSPH